MRVNPAWRNNKRGFCNISISYQTKITSFLTPGYNWGFYDSPLMCIKKWWNRQQKLRWQIILEIIHYHNIWKLINNAVFNCSWSCFTTTVFIPLSCMLCQLAKRNVEIKRREKEKQRNGSDWEWERHCIERGKEK